MIAKKWIIKPRKKEDLIEQILYNRGFRTREMIDEFLNPSLSNLPDIFSFKNMRLAVERLKKAQQNHETIIVFGDYDVDGETAAAIVWETLYKLGFAVLPYLPSREEGYGLNIQAIEKFKNEGVSLIITVDCGISSVAEIKLAKKLGIDTIVTDHHQPGNQLPEALAIVHSDELAGVGVAWFLSQAILQEFKKRSQVKDFLDLVALGTIADLSPLLGSNRILVKHGIDVLRKTERIGLKILIREAGLDLGEIDTYEIGFILAPRLNAMGRIHHAISSLRLLCTRDLRQAVELSKKLNLKNTERQDLTAGSYEQARRMVLGKVDFPKALIIASQEWHEGIIGLVAGRLVEEFYRPAIVLSLGEKVSKGSVRSIPGFNIIQSLREFEEYFIDLGGHPAAAGFSIETVKIEEFKKDFLQTVEKKIGADLLCPFLDIDAEIELHAINQNFYNRLSKLSPFGMGNPEPLFLARNLEVLESRLVGKEKSHLKLKVKDKNSNPFEAIGFGLGLKEEILQLIQKKEPLDCVFKISENTWQEQKILQLKMIDIKAS